MVTLVESEGKESFVEYAIVMWQLTVNGKVQFIDTLQQAT